MLVDTGASVVALTGADARAAGLMWSAADIRPIAQGASGPVAGMAIMKEEEVDAVGTVEEINGVVLDLSSFDASDPEITIKEAINISD